MINFTLPIGSELENRNTKAVSLNNKYLIVPHEIVASIFSWIPISNLYLKDITTLPCVSLQWREVAQSMFPFQVIKLLMKKENKIFGKVGSRIKHVSCWNSLIAYNIISGAYSKLYLHNMWNNKQIFYRSKKNFKHQFLHLNSNSFIISEQRKEDWNLGRISTYIRNSSIYSHDGLSLNNNELSNKQVEGTILSYNPKQNLIITGCTVMTYFSSRDDFSKQKLQIFCTNGQMLAKIAMQEDDWIKKSFETYKFCTYGINLIQCSEKHLMIGWEMGPFKEEMRRDKPSFLLHLYEISTGKLLISKPLQEEISRIVSDDQRMIAVCIKGKVLILDSYTFDIKDSLHLDIQDSVHRDEIESDEVMDLRLYKDYLVCLFKSGRLVVVNLSKKQIHSQFNPASILAVTENYLFAGHLGKPLIDVWDLDTQQFLGGIETKAPVEKLDVKKSEEGICLIAGLRNGQVQVWKDYFPRQRNMLDRINEYLKNIFK